MRLAERVLVVGGGPQSINQGWGRPTWWTGWTWPTSDGKHAESTQPLPACLHPPPCMQAGATDGRTDRWMDGLGICWPACLAELMCLPACRGGGGGVGGVVISVMEVNFFSMVQLVKAALPLLKTNARLPGARPRVVTVTSFAALFPAQALFSAYAASKHAADAFTNALAQELRHFNIQVTDHRTQAGRPAATAGDG